LVIISGGSYPPIVEKAGTTFGLNIPSWKSNLWINIDIYFSFVKRADVEMGAGKRGCD